MRAEKVDGGHEDEPGEDAAGEHDGGDTEADDVADAEVLGRAVGAEGGAFEDVLGAAEVGFDVGLGGPECEEIVVLEESVEGAEAEAEKDAGGEGAAAFAGHEDVGAGGAFGVDEGALFFDDELAAEGDHEQDAEPAAKEGESEDAGGLEVEAEEDEGGEGEDDARGDGLAGVADGLDDVVFEDRRFAEGAEDGDGEDGDRDRGGDGEPGAEADVDSDRAEEDGEDGAEEQGAEGELGARVRGRDERLKGGVRHGLLGFSGAALHGSVTAARGPLTREDGSGIYFSHGAVGPTWSAIE